jgi:hypothetical protein
MSAATNSTLFPAEPHLGLFTAPVSQKREQKAFYSLASGDRFRTVFPEGSSSLLLADLLWQAGVIDENCSVSESFKKIPLPSFDPERILQKFLNLELTLTDRSGLVDICTKSSLISLLQHFQEGSCELVGGIVPYLLGPAYFYEVLNSVNVTIEKDSQIHKLFEDLATFPQDVDCRMRWQELPSKELIIELTSKMCKKDPNWLRTEGFCKLGPVPGESPLFLTRFNGRFEGSPKRNCLFDIVIENELVREHLFISHALRLDITSFIKNGSRVSYFPLCNDQLGLQAIIDRLLKIARIDNPETCDINAWPMEMVRQTQGYVSLKMDKHDVNRDEIFIAKMQKDPACYEKRHLFFSKLLLAKWETHLAKNNLALLPLTLRACSSLQATFDASEITLFWQEMMKLYPISSKTPRWVLLLRALIEDGGFLFPEAFQIAHEGVFKRLEHFLKIVPTLLVRSKTGDVRDHLTSAIFERLQIARMALMASDSQDDMASRLVACLVKEKKFTHIGKSLFCFFFEAAHEKERYFVRIATELMQSHTSFVLYMLKKVSMELSLETALSLLNTLCLVFQNNNMHCDDPILLLTVTRMCLERLSDSASISLPALQWQARVLGDIGEFRLAIQFLHLLSKKIAHAQLTDVWQALSVCALRHRQGGDLVALHVWQEGLGVLDTDLQILRTIFSVAGSSAKRSFSFLFERQSRDSQFHARLQQIVKEKIAALISSNQLDAAQTLLDGVAITEEERLHVQVLIVQAHFQNRQYIEALARLKELPRAVSAISELQGCVEKYFESLMRRHDLDSAYRLICMPGVQGSYYDAMLHTFSDLFLNSKNASKQRSMGFGLINMLLERVHHSLPAYRKNLLENLAQCLQVSLKWKDDFPALTKSELFLGSKQLFSLVKKENLPHVLISFIELFGALKIGLEESADVYTVQKWAAVECVKSASSLSTSCRKLFLRSLSRLSPENFTLSEIEPFFTHALVFDSWKLLQFVRSHFSREDCVRLWGNEKAKFFSTGDFELKCSFVSWSLGFIDDPFSLQELGIQALEINDRKLLYDFYASWERNVEQAFENYKALFGLALKALVKSGDRKLVSWIKDADVRRPFIAQLQSLDCSCMLLEGAVGFLSDDAVALAVIEQRNRVNTLLPKFDPQFVIELMKHKNPRYIVEALRRLQLLFDADIPIVRSVFSALLDFLRQSHDEGPAELVSAVDAILSHRKVKESVSSREMKMLCKHFLIYRLRQGVHKSTDEKYAIAQFVANRIKNDAIGLQVELQEVLDPLIYSIHPDDTMAYYSHISELWGVVETCNLSLSSPSKLVEYALFLQLNFPESTLPKCSDVNVVVEVIEKMIQLQVPHAMWRAVCLLINTSSEFVKHGLYRELKQCFEILFVAVEKNPYYTISLRNFPHITDPILFRSKNPQELLLQQRHRLSLIGMLVGQYSTVALDVRVRERIRSSIPLKVMTAVFCTLCKAEDLASLWRAAILLKAVQEMFYEHGQIEELYSCYSLFFSKIERSAESYFPVEAFAKAKSLGEKYAFLGSLDVYVMAYREILDFELKVGSFLIAYPQTLLAFVEGLVKVDLISITSYPMQVRAFSKVYISYIQALFAMHKRSQTASQAQMIIKLLASHLCQYVERQYISHDPAGFLILLETMQNQMVDDMQQAILKEIVHGCFSSTVDAYYGTTKQHERYLKIRDLFKARIL